MLYRQFLLNQSHNPILNFVWWLVKLTDKGIAVIAFVEDSWCGQISGALGNDLIVATGPERNESIDPTAYIGPPPLDFKEGIVV